MADREAFICLLLGEFRTETEKEIPDTKCLRYERGNIRQCGKPESSNKVSYPIHRGSIVLRRETEAEKQMYENGHY